MKKRLLSMLLVLVMVIGILPTAAMAAENDPVEVEFKKVVQGLSLDKVPEDHDIDFDFRLDGPGRNHSHDDGKFEEDFDFDLEKGKGTNGFDDFSYNAETGVFTSLDKETEEMYVGETYTLTEKVEYPTGYNGPKECVLTLKAEPEDRASLTEKKDENNKTYWEIVVYDPVTITAYNNYAPKQTYTLTYDVNGGTGAPASQTGSSSTGSYDFTVSSVEPTKDGWHFMGWADSANETTVNYHPGRTITLYQANPTKTIYAVWGGHEDAGGDGFCDNGGECLHDHDNDGYCTVDGCNHPHGDNDCCPLKPQQPTVPGVPSDYDKLKELLGNEIVKIDCTNTEIDPQHSDRTYGLLAGSYTIGDVEKNQTTGVYTCTITVTPDAYVALYNSDIGVNHTLDPADQTGTITLHYAPDPNNLDGTVSTWQVKSGVPVTFTVDCETPEPEKPATPTDEQLIRLLAGKITVDCVNTEIDPKHDNKTYGLLTDSYTIGAVEGDATNGYTCNVTIKPATYVAEYNKTLSGHTAAEGETDKTIVLEMGGTGWIVSSGAPVTFYVECVSYTLTYDANGGKIGEETSVKTSGLTAQKDYALNKAIVPTYTVAEGETAIVFIGWTTTKSNTIYAAGDAAPTTIEKVDIDKDVTVYAAWGYDTNGDGIADVNQIPVYVYAKFENSADQQIKALPLNAPSSLELNDHGWLTLGYVLVDGVDGTVNKDTAVAELSKTNGFIRYDVNAAFDLSLVSSSSWTLTQAYGADDYVESGTCYHLDGVIPVYQVTYDANGGAGAPDAEQYLLPDTEHPLNSTTKPTHKKVNNVDVVFIGWTAEKDEYIYAAGDTAPVTISQVTVPANDAAGNETDVTVYAVYGLDTNNNDIADVLETKYTVTYNDGVENKEVFEDQVYNDLLVGDDTPAFDGTPTRPGYRFVGWTPEWSETVTDNVIYTAQWCRSYHHTTSTEAKPTLNKADHYAYVVGYPDGTVQPQGAITRAEVATIFFRLLSDETRDQYWTKSNGYTDVSSGNWFNNAVSTLSNAGIINGYPDGTFRPNAPITRAEMAKVIAMFAELDKDSEGFKDIAGHWAEAYIKLAAGNGWIAGYPDGTFRPNQYITRAETMTMINRVLERVPSEEEHLLSRRVMLTFPDNQPGDWYYIAVQEATNSHTYERYATEKNGDEQWIKLIDNYDWTKLEF